MTSVALQLVHESQISLRSPWTGDRQVLNRGYAHWAGSAEFGGSSLNNDEWLEIESFLSSLDGVANWFQLPHYRPRAPIDGLIVTRSERVSDTDDTIQHVLSGNVNAVKPGQMVSSGVRSFKIRSGAMQGSNMSVVLDPQIPLTVNSVVNGSNAIRVSASEGSGPLMRLFKETAGPWTMSWREAL